MIIATENTKAVTNDNDLATLVKGDVIKVGCRFSDDYFFNQTPLQEMVYWGREVRKKKSWLGLVTTQKSIYLFLKRTAAVNVPDTDYVISQVDLDVTKAKHNYLDGVLYVSLSEVYAVFPGMPSYQNALVQLQSAGLI